MTQQLLGVYDFSHHRIEIFTDDAKSGGEFYLIPENAPERLPRIILGIDWGEHQWPQVLSILLHEVFEAIMSLTGVRYEPAPGYSWGADRYVFHFSHTQFSEICARSAEGLMKAMPDLSCAFLDSNRKRRAARIKAAKEIDAANKEKKAQEEIEAAKKRAAARSKQLIPMEEGEDEFE